jgi:hypothetical protein
MDIPKLHPNLQPQHTQGGQNFQPEYKLQVMRDRSLAQAATARDQGASGQTTISTSLAQRSWGLGTAAIEGVNRLMNAVTTIFTTPRPTPVVSGQPPAGGGGSTSPTVSVPPPPPPPPAPAPQSLIPSWARMFEYTGNSQWHPGGTTERAYIDFRKELKGDIETLEILSPDGTTVIARGRFEKQTRDEKQRFRFDVLAKNLPPGAIIKATLKPNKDGGHGGIRYIEIPRPGKTMKF